MNNVAIIPARGGSKRIPRKNIRDFLGKPVIAYSIQTAIESKLFDEVMVSTDDVEIAEIATKYGAKVPFMRSEKNADDFANTADVILEVIDEYKKRNIAFENGCCIYPAAPLAQTKHLSDGFRLLTTEKFNSVFPVVAFSYPVWRGLEWNENGKVQMVWPEYLNSRSQELRKVFHDAGQWYWFNVYALVSGKNLFTGNSSSIEVRETEVQDIDSETDWRIAEMKYKLLHEQS
jgi:N-acylneuraminate cytidylyltransferase